MDGDEFYSFTNESLAAIMKGLDIADGDFVLAVCGSGDQAFAMTEKANVVAVDIREFQVAYAKDRAGLLQARKFRQFLGKSCKRDFLAMLGLLPQEIVSLKCSCRLRDSFHAAFAQEEWARLCFFGHDCVLSPGTSQA